MSWNYRVCKSTVNWTVADQNGETTTYALHEVYYNKDGSIWAVSSNPTPLLTDTAPGNCSTEQEAVEALKWTHQRMAEALTKPVIDLDTVTYSNPDDSDDDLDDLDQIERDLAALDLEELEGLDSDRTFGFYNKENDS